MSPQTITSRRSLRSQPPSLFSQTSFSHELNLRFHSRVHIHRTNYCRLCDPIYFNNSMLKVGRMPSSSGVLNTEKLYLDDYDFLARAIPIHSRPLPPFSLPLQVF